MAAELDGDRENRPDAAQAGASLEPAGKASDERLESRLLRLLLRSNTGPVAHDPTKEGAWTAGGLVALLGFEDERADLCGSLYADLYPADVGGAPSSAPSSAMRERGEMTATCRADLLARGLCSMAMSIGQGGLIAAIARACIGQHDPRLAVGCALVLPAPRQVGTHPPASVAAQLFHEAPGRVLIAIPAVRYAEATLLATSHGVPLVPLGRSGGRELVVRASDGERSFREVLRVSVAELAVGQSP